MRVLKFSYHMDIQFDMPVREHHFTLKCLPHSGLGQLVESINFRVFPNHYISRSVDSFANECIYGYCEEEHDHFLVEVEGIVRAGMPIQAVSEETELICIFRYQTPHTMPGQELKAYNDRLKNEQDGMSVYDKVRHTMHRLYQDFRYESGTTQIETTAEKAFCQGYGVCQDYTHILLSLLRMEKIPCRYITGMMEGEGYSHAWVEAYTENGWVALDPTNDLVISDSHICISRGRDYKDCMLNQGIFIGCEGPANQDQTIRVEVTDIGQNAFQ